MAAPDSALQPGIEKTPGICGGDARIAGTRIPVWLLVAFRDEGMTDAELLQNYPSLSVEDLTHAWKYATVHSQEIAAAIRANGNKD